MASRCKPKLLYKSRLPPRLPPEQQSRAARFSQISRRHRSTWRRGGGRPGELYSTGGAPPPPNKRRRELTSYCCRRRNRRRRRPPPDDRRAHNSRGEAPSLMGQEGPSGAKEAGMKSATPATRRPQTTRPDAGNLTGTPKLLARQP